MPRTPLLLLAALPLAAGSVRIWQTNSAGDNMDVIYAATNKVVLKVKDIEVPHGVAYCVIGVDPYTSDLICHSRKLLPLLAIECNRKAPEPILREPALLPANSRTIFIWNDGQAD